MQKRHLMHIVTVPYDRVVDSASIGDPTDSNLSNCQMKFHMTMLSLSICQMKPKLAKQHMHYVFNCISAQLKKEKKLCLCSPRSLLLQSWTNYKGEKDCESPSGTNCTKSTDIMQQRHLLCASITTNKHNDSIIASS